MVKFKALTSSSKVLFGSGCVNTGSEVRISIIRFNALVQVGVQKKGCSFFSRCVRGLTMWENPGTKALW